MVKKAQTMFKVVGLEEVFKTAVEVDGTWILEKTIPPEPKKAELQPHGVRKQERELQQQKRERVCQAKS